MNKYQAAWLTAATIFGHQDAFAGTETADASSAPKGVRIGVQYRNACDLLFAEDCTGERKRIELTTPGNSKGYSVWSYETFDETARNTFLNKSISQPVIGNAHVEAGWQAHLKGWLAGYDKYFTFGDTATVKLGASGGRIGGDAKLSGNAGYQLSGGTYQNSGFTIPGRDINIPAVNQPAETIIWPAINVSASGQTVNIPAGTVKTPPINFGGADVHIPSITVPPFKVTIPAMQREWQRTVSVGRETYFGELRAAAALDKTFNHVRLTFNPYGVVDSRAYYGAGAGVVIGTSSLEGNAANADAYLHKPFVPAEGHALTVMFDRRTTAFDLAYWGEQQGAKAIASDISARLQTYAGELNNAVASEAQKVGVTVPSLKSPAVTRDQVLNAMGVQSPLGTETSLLVGVGGNVQKHVTYAVGATVPLRAKLPGTQYSATITYKFD